MLCFEDAHSVAWQGGGGKWGYAPWGAGLGGTPAQFLQAFKTRF